MNVDTVEKKNQETFSLKNSGDFFKKMVILDGNSKLWTDDDGIMYVGVIPFYWKSPLYHNIDIQNNPKSTTGLGFCMYT